MLSNDNAKQCSCKAMMFNGKECLQTQETVGILVQIRYAVAKRSYSLLVLVLQRYYNKREL